ncbi:MAG: LysR substrate-binding domain-containing protein [Myxococcota bacterium]|nr:LysR substrate-binding domain-containing protein [Myxococcota bacterium]
MGDATRGKNDDLPSTASLRAFLCAARTLSFKQAAAELHVSPSALSRRIQGLEDELGVALFHRRNPGLELTEAGARYRARIEPLLRDLQRAGEALAPGRAGPLRVSALESFSARWLVPRLPELAARHPELDVELEATLRYADFERDPVDVAIRFGTGPWDGLHGEPIVDLHFFPVCSPALRDGDPPLAAPADLARHVWIHVSQVPDAWSTWARGIGQPELRGRRALVFDHVAIALSAAESGQGVALSAPLLCAAELADGRLCIPFDLGELGTLVK